MFKASILTIKTTTTIKHLGHLTAYHLFAFQELAKFEEMEEKVMLSEKGALICVNLLSYILYMFTLRKKNYCFLF